jgi:hypothetical protein
MSVNAKKFLTPIDLSQNELRKAVIENTSTVPSGGTYVTGQLVSVGTTLIDLYVYSGTSGWAKLTRSGTITSADLAAVSGIALTGSTNSFNNTQTITLTSGNNKGLVILANTVSQTANLTEWTNQSGVTGLAVDGSGQVNWGPTSGTQSALVPTTGAAKIVTQTNTVGLKVLANSAQSGVNVTEWQTSTGTVTTAIGATGSLLAYQGLSTTVVRDITSNSVAMTVSANQNIQIGSLTTSYGNGQGVIGITSATVTPNTNPTGGGILYVDAGTLKYLGTSGTATVVAYANGASTGGVTSVNGLTGAITGIATTANSLAQFGSTTSAQVASIITDETGSGSLVFATSPTLANVTLGTVYSANLANATGLPVSTGLSGLATGVATFLANPTSANLASLVTDETGTGALVFAGSPALTGTVTANAITFSGNVTLAADPGSAMQAATKQYVDNIASGINVHDAVKYATTNSLFGDSNNFSVSGAYSLTYVNGTSGVGATLTATPVGGAIWTSNTIDGQTLNVGDRILIKDQTGSYQNGIYTVTNVAAISSTSSFVFTRATDSDQVPELSAGDLTYILNGTQNKGSSWVQTATVVTVGSDSIIWSQFAGASTTSAGKGLIANGSAFDVTSTTLAVTTDAVNLAVVTYSNSTPSATTSFISGLTTDQYGRVTGVATTTHSVATSSVAGIASFPTANFTITGNAISITNVAGSVVSGAVATATQAISSTNVIVTESTTSATYYPVFSNSASTGTKGLLQNSGTNAISFNPSTGTLSATIFSGSGASLTGLNLANVSGTLATSAGGLGYAPTLTANTAFYVNSSGTGITNGTLPITAGGTGSTTANTARTALAATGKYTANNIALTMTSNSVSWSVPAATHLLGTTGGLIVTMKDNSTNSIVEPDIQITETGDVTINWATSANVAASAYRVTIIG